MTNELIFFEFKSLLQLQIENIYFYFAFNSTIVHFQGELNWAGKKIKFGSIRNSVIISDMVLSIGSFLMFSGVVEMKIGLTRVNLVVLVLTLSKSLPSQLAFTCPKLSVETLEQGAKYVQN